MKNRPLAERIALVSLAVLVAAWIIGALVNTPVFFQPVLFGLGTGTIIAALALGLRHIRPLDEGEGNDRSAA